MPLSRRGMPISQKADDAYFLRPSPDACLFRILKAVPLGGSMISF